MSFNVTDIIVLLAILYFAFSGWTKGFLRSLNGPISLIICVGLGVMYFHKTQNIMLCLGITIIGPLVMNILLGLLLDVLQKADNKLNVVSFISRLGGMTLSLGWSGSMLLLSVLLVSIMPAKLFGMESVKENVLRSTTYSVIVKMIPAPWSPGGASGSSHAGRADGVGASGAEGLEGLEESPEFQALMADPRIRDIFRDEETLDQIKNQDIAKLLANEKILGILQDPELLKKFFSMYQKIQSLGPQSDVNPTSLP